MVVLPANFNRQGYLVRQSVFIWLLVVLMLASAEKSALAACQHSGNGHQFQSIIFDRASGAAPLSLTVTWPERELPYDSPPEDWCPSHLYEPFYFIDWGDGAEDDIPSTTRSAPLPSRPNYRLKLFAAGSTIHRYDSAGTYVVRVKFLDGPLTSYVAVGTVVVEPAPDADGDGVSDAVDRCPTQVGPASNQGCPPSADLDGDGLRGAADSCPNDPGPTSKNGCPLIRQFEIVYMAFIPANYTDVPSPELTCFAGPPFGGALPLIFEADDRTFDYSAMARKRYRIAVLVKVQEKIDHRGWSTYTLLADPNPTRITDSVSFVAGILPQSGQRSALVHGVKGRIDPSDRDRDTAGHFKLKDCNLMHDKGRGALSNLRQPYILGQEAKNRTVQVAFRGKGRVGLAQVLVPAIDWDLRVTIRTGGTRPLASVWGTHDQFPAHEVYVNGTPVHCYSPLSKSYPFACDSAAQKAKLPVLTFNFLDPLLGLNSPLSVSTPLRKITAPPPQ